MTEKVYKRKELEDMEVEQFMRLVTERRCGKALRTVLIERVLKTQ